MASLDVTTLTQPVTLCFSGKKAPNRIFKAAMTERLCTYSEDEFARGEPTEELERVYDIWGKGGVGIFHTGNIMLDRTRVEAKGCAIIDPDIPKSYVPAFARLQRAIAQSPTPPLLIGQLAHIGGYVSTNSQSHPVVAAEGALQNADASPAHWTREGIRNVVERFAFGARTLKDAGFDGVQIHGAYGYLITQFLSRHNKRADEYGGSLDNRSRLLFEIIDAIKTRVDDPTFLLSVKFSAPDFLDDGLPTPEPQELARSLEEAEVDYIELSGGMFGKPAFEHTMDLRQLQFLDFAKQIRSGLKQTKLAVTGGFKSAESMVDAVTSGVTDFVGLARSLAHEPNFAGDILAGRVTRVKPNRLPASLAVNLDAGIAQIQRMGKGLELIDFGDQGVVDEWMRERDGL